VLHRDPSSPRYSDDIDIFHDAAALVGMNDTDDAAVLVGAGFTVTWQNRTDGFHRAWVERGGRLHDADLAVNKAWAATGKDPGLSPLLILNELTRHTKYQDSPKSVSACRSRCCH
jgi:hypothetical protein